MTNYIELFMQENKLAVDERFKITWNEIVCRMMCYIDDKYDLYIVTPKIYDSKENEYLSLRITHHLQKGEYGIEKLPFRPKLDEGYWFYCNNSGVTLVERYQGSLLDALLIKNNFVFRTREEAEDPKNIARVKEYCGVLEYEA